MKTILISLFSFALFAQSTGTVVEKVDKTVTATAGAVVCVFKSTVPAPPTGVNVVCTTAGANMTLDAVIPVGTPNGIAGQFTAGSESITWILTQTSASSGVAYQIAANGVSKSGSF